MNGSFKRYVDLSTKIGGVVAGHAEIVARAFKAQRDFLAVVASSKDPKNPATIEALLKPTSVEITNVVEFRDKNRGAKDFANHLAALSEGIPALGWVLAAPKPAPHVQQSKESAEFYTNRVLKEFKDKDETHKEWSKSFPAVLLELQEFVKKNHTTGLVWNAKGGDAKPGAAPAAAPAAAAPAPAKAAAAPAAAAAAGPGGAKALFSELNQGGNVTSGLKKVDRSQMTHKNPELRSTSVVKTVEKEVAVKETNPPRLELDGNKWAVEYQINNKSIVIEETETKQTVYVFKCVNSTIVIKGKVNGVVLDSCKKTAVVVESVISGVEAINDQSCQLQILGKCPTLTIEKTDGMQVYLSKDSLDVEILTAKSSEMNISVPGKTENDDLVESPIPEQFKTVYDGSKWVTNTVVHSG